MSVWAVSSFGKVGSILVVGLGGKGENRQLYT